MTDLRQIRDQIVIPALIAIDAYSIEAEQLVMATGMTESLYKHTRQIARYSPLAYGPARGYFQMEPATHDDIWSHYLGATRRAYLVDGLHKISDHPGAVDELVENQQYAAAMCRIFYMRVPAPLPRPGDWAGMAAYWKRYYNTKYGKGTVAGFMAKAAPVIDLYRGCA